MKYPVVTCSRVAFEIRCDGLYQSTDSSRWEKIGSLVTALSIGISRSGLVVSAGMGKEERRAEEPSAGPSLPPRSENGGLIADQPVATAMKHLSAKLALGNSIIDLTRHRDVARGDTGLGSGYIVNVPGSGRMFAIKPEALRGWVSGSLPIGSILKALEERGWLKGRRRKNDAPSLHPDGREASVLLPKARGWRASVDACRR
jgi:hypothetical protein